VDGGSPFADEVGGGGQLAQGVVVAGAADAVAEQQQGRGP
jgi:hypothetical protein